ncbi:MAG: M48 family metalloprotease [Bacteroidota bacterium]
MSYLTKLFLALLLLGLWACGDNIDPPVKPSELTKAKREQLGDRLRLSIATDQELFPVLPAIPPYDTSVYWYIQTLYNQVTNVMHLDKQSPVADRWDSSRKWSVTVLDKENRNAFILPGGHLYITTGMLKGMRDEYELYYLLAFEASVMNEKYLLNHLIANYSSTVLNSLALASPSTSNGAMAEFISQMELDQEEVRSLDLITAELICETSIIDPKGIIPIIEFLDLSVDWLKNRPSYGNRSEYIMNEINTPRQVESCGNFKSNGGYQRYVLDKLE